MDSLDIWLELEVGVVFARHLGSPQLTVENDEYARAYTHLIDGHPEGIAIGLSGWPVVL